MYYNSYTITCKSRKYVTDLPLSSQVSVLGSTKTKVNQQDLMRSDNIAYPWEQESLPKALVGALEGQYQEELKAR